jgi:hypothetical protein
MNGDAVSPPLPALNVPVRGVLPDESRILRLEILGCVSARRAMRVFKARVAGTAPASWGLPAGAPCAVKLYRAPRAAAAAVRAGALWQKCIRRSAAARLGAADAAADIHATFAVEGGRLAGTIEEWVDGRMWKLETDDRLFDRPKPGPKPDYRAPAGHTSEYVAKRFFVARFNRLLREMGAERLAGRYRWLLRRSLQRVLKRTSAGAGAAEGLTAVDFAHRGDSLPRLRAFIREHPDWFDGFDPLIGELEQKELRSPAGTLPMNDAQVWWDLPVSTPPRRPSASLGERIALPYRLFFNAAARTSWVSGLVEDGVRAGTLPESEAARIRAETRDPYVQVYLKCLAVHLCLLPSTPIITIAGGWLYAAARGLTFPEGMARVGLALAFFCVAPFSPGSILRGLYVMGVILWRRELRRLRIALLLSFWRYVGYLAFPIQMARTFPALARFLAARWATRAVHLVPGLGRPGDLLEHRVFDLFFNLPLTLGRMLRDRRAAASAHARTGIPP